MASTGLPDNERTHGAADLRILTGDQDWISGSVPIVGRHSWYSESQFVDSETSNRGMRPETPSLQRLGKCSPRREPPTR